MRYIWIISLLITLSNTEEMTPVEHSSLHSYNNKSLLKNRSERNAHRLHKIDEVQAKEIAKAICGETIESLELRHTKCRLYYIAKSKKCTTNIDALDGSVVQAEDTDGGEKR